MLPMNLLEVPLGRQNVLLAESALGERPAGPLRPPQEMLHEVIDVIVCNRAPWGRVPDSYGAFGKALWPATPRRLN